MAKKTSSRTSGKASPLDRKIATVEKKVCGQREAPDSLRALWEEFLDKKKKSFFAAPCFGELSLLTKESENSHHYVSGVDGEVWELLFQEIAWVAQEADGGLVGFFHGARDTLEEAPVVWLDNEGSLSVTGGNLFEHFEGLGVECDDSDDSAVEAMRLWCEHNHHTKSGVDSKDLADPDARFEELRRLVDAGATQGDSRRFVDTHPTCQSLEGRVIVVANEDLLVPYEEKAGEHAAFVFESALSRFRLVEGLPVSAYLSLHAAGVFEGQAVFVKADEEESQVFLYDLTQSKWTVGAAQNSAHESAAVALCGTQVVVVAGAMYGNATDGVSAYDLQTEKWSALAELPVGRMRLGLVTLPDGHLFAFGGEAELEDDDYPEYQPNCDLYSSAKNKWSAAAPMPQVLESPHGVVLQDGRVLVVGDEGDFALYDPKKNAWTKVTQSKNVGRPFVVQADGTVLFFGCERNGVRLGVSKMDPANLAVSPVGESLLPRDDEAQATLLPDGRVLLVGGRLFDNIDCEAEIWDPATQNGAPLAGFDKFVTRQQKNLAKYLAKQL